jgi:drug/metabolite transporter superfamily protein YnfA
MKIVNCLIYVGVFAASYILVDLASSQTSFSRSDVTGIGVGCIVGGAAMLYMQRQMRQQAS